MTASHPAPAHVLSRVAPTFLAADVGGTHVRVARVQASGDAAHPVQVL
ncbi:MAG TPA: glucokinase, partial [Stenotrophomonas sp.]|nr:glucokinase [Stenotrophomonas sp.]